MNLLPHITFETGESPRHSIIWLHGLGADSEDFAPIAEEMQLSVPVRYIFPDAPMRPVTVNGGFVMPAWYDVAGDEMDVQQDEAGIRASRDAIEALIEQEKQRGIAAGNIYLAGFSQGGAIALYTGLLHAQPLGGIIALSTYLPLAESFSGCCGGGVVNRPLIFMAHGLGDPIVSHDLGMESAELLGSLGCKVEWHEYEMPHLVSMSEVRDIEAWLARRLASAAQ